MVEPERMRLVGKKFHRKELKDTTLEWWVLSFEKGNDKITQTIDKKEYNAKEWIDGAFYNVQKIQPADLIESTVPVEYGTWLQAKLSDFGLTKKP